MLSTFHRPSSLPYPSIYYHFRAPDADGGDTVQYSIRDFPQDRYEEGIDFMVGHFISEEPIFKARDVIKDEIAIGEARDVWRKMLAENISIGCFRAGSDDIVAMNVLTVKMRYGDEDTSKFRSRNLRDIFNLHRALERRFDPFEHYNVEAFLFAFGCAVHPDYRCRGIATEMLKVRPTLLRALHLKVTTSHFIGAAAQNTATKAGYEENLVVT
jgi:hypothetical protein